MEVQEVVVVVGDGEGAVVMVGEGAMMPRRRRRIAGSRRSRRRSRRRGKRGGDLGFGAG